MAPMTAEERDYPKGALFLMVPGQVPRRGSGGKHSGNTAIQLGLLSK